MTLTERLVEADTEYERVFGEGTCLGVQWLEGHFNGDVDAYIKFVQKAIRDRKPVPDYEAAHGITADELT